VEALLRTSAINCTGICDLGVERGLHPITTDAERECKPRCSRSEGKRKPRDKSLITGGWSEIAGRLFPNGLEELAVGFHLGSEYCPEESCMIGGTRSMLNDAKGYTYNKSHDGCEV
jgi:hypothetical protein